MDDSVEAAQTLLADSSERRLVQALEAQLTIGQAVGMLMERHRLGEEQALRLLAEGAARAELTLRENAERLVEECNAAFAQVERHGWTIRPAGATAARRATQVPQKVR